MRIATADNVVELVTGPERVPDRMLAAWSKANDGADIAVAAQEYSRAKKQRGQLKQIAIIVSIAAVLGLAGFALLAIATNDDHLQSLAIIPGVPALVVVLFLASFAGDSRKSAKNERTRDIVTAFAADINQLSRLTGRLPSAFEQMGIEEMRLMGRSLVVAEAVKVVHTLSPKGNPTPKTTAKAMESLEAVDAFLKRLGIESDLDDCFEAAKPLAEREKQEAARLAQEAAAREEARRREEAQARERAEAEDRQRREREAQPPADQQPVRREGEGGEGNDVIIAGAAAATS